MFSIIKEFSSNHIVHTKLIYFISMIKRWDEEISLICQKKCVFKYEKQLKKKLLN